MHLDGGRRRGFFLTLEGPEGSGKSTQAQRLADTLTASGRRCVLAREPGGTRLGEEVRQILLHAPDLSPVPATDALLFNAARAQLAAEVIEPALERGEIVICDRFGDSTMAYQGYGAGEPLDALRQLTLYAVGDLRPDLTMLIDLPVEEGLRRKQGGEITRFEERADLAFHRRVREGFLALAAAEPDRFLVIDGRQAPDLVQSAILEAVQPRLAARDESAAVNVEPATKDSPAQASEPDSGSLRMNG
ncbi:MAG: dTMP kinase [Candidatus Limnocylindrales bacterium]|jgi:dTMP kinase